jgi:exoribonuclease-2
MIGPKSLALYKNRPVIVLEVRDRLEIRLEDGSTLRVRDKDLEALHPGPATAIPHPAEGGDFETARAMAEAGSLLAWAEAADLVFGAAGPAEVLACWREGLEGKRFRLQEGGLVPLSDAEVAKEAEKRARKEGEAAERAAFLEKAKKARSGKAEEAFLPGDERFLAELEAFALGKSQKCRLAGDLGLTETPEGVQAFLLKARRWDEFVNPHPLRAGCSLGAPKMSLGDFESPFPRVDLRDLRSWAVDNAWSHDPDDAVAWDGRYVYVHIADPAGILRPGDSADIEALGRGATLYLPESTSPMLPDEALTRLGLGLADTSPALTFKMGLGSEGGIETVDIFPSTVRVRRSHYAEADSFLGTGQAPELDALAKIAELRLARRIEGGAIEIDIPEVRIFVKDREVFIETLPDTRSSGIIREMMLLAGEGAARWAFERSLAFPYYSQEAPGEVGEVAAGEGLSAQFARRRLMRGGITGPTPGAHRGLGLPFYAQATSPLRRYQDLLGHYQIRAFLEGREAMDTDEVMRRCATAQAGSAATRQAERASDQHWSLAYLLRHPEWRGEGIIVGGSGPAWQAYIPSLGLETRLKLGPGRTLDEAVGLKAARIDLASLESSFEEA